MASKSKRRRKVLGASCILAALIVAGSSFAWFTSKDEVTNRLSASADYGVTIAEDFQPPENWVPGQKIEKNVGVVNTGNIDAFVRTRLEGEMRLTAESRDKAAWKAVDGSTPAGMYISTAGVLTTASSVATSNSAIGSLATTTDDKLKDLGLTYSYTAGGADDPIYYIKELDKTYKSSNPTVNGSGTDNVAFTEVESVQAGGTLAYFDGTGTFTYTPQKAIDIVNSNDDHVVLQKGYTYTVSAGSSQTIDVIKGTDNDTAKTGTITYSNMQGFVDALGQYIDCTSFKPTTSGLYIFRRNAERTGTGNSQTDDFEFTGYYYVANEAATTGGGKYFALQYENDGSQRSSYVLEDDTYTYTYDYTTATGTFRPTNSTKAVTLFTAEQQLLKTTDDAQKLHWVYDSTNSTLTATYDGADNTVGGNDDLKIKVQLANIAAATDASNAEKWTAIGTAYVADSGSGATKGEWSFYYNNDLEEGATTSRLVDDLTLDEDTTNDAYLAFDFDLNVYSESVQVTLDDNGAETVTSAQTNFDDANGYVAIKATNGAKKGGTGAEIDWVEWTK